MATDPKVIAVAFALKQSLEQNGGAGSSINAHPNQFFLNVNGAVDLYKMAEAALARAVSYEENLRTQFEDGVKVLANKIGAELRMGAVSVEDALARLKTKAGGELLAGIGVLEEAVSRVEATLRLGSPKGADAATAASAVDGH